MSLSKQLNLSFAGCGFLGIYHIGVASCFKEYAPNILLNNLSGASAGAMAACCLLCGVPMGQVTSDVLKVATIARKNTFGAFSPGFNITKIIRDRLREALPSNAHKICSGRLHVSVTKLPRGENVILSEFNSKEELIQAIICSTFIPFFSGYVPEKFRGERYIDGCYSNNLPILDENTITVSPFCGESDICPQDNSYNLFQVNFNNTSIELSPQNLLRIVQILFPPPVEVLADMCKQGFDDGLRYLQRNTLVSCVRCIAVNSEVQLEDALQHSDSDSECLSDYDEDYDDDDNEEDDEDDDDDSVCDECNQRRMLASVEDFPETVLSVLDEAALSMNSGLISWVFKHKSMRVLSVLTLPYVLPFDIARAVYSKFIDIVPKVGKDISLISKWILTYLKNFLKRFTAERHLYGAKFSCQLAITEYDFAFQEQTPLRKRSRSVVALRSISRRSSFSQRPLSGEWGPCPHRAKRNSPGSRRMSCVNFGFSVDLAGQLSSTNKPLVKALDAGKLESKVVDLANSTLLNWQSPVLDKCETVLNAESADTFDQVLQVTRQQESIMAYYYLDGNNRMQVREIFDATSPECQILPQEEYEAIRNMEWDEAFNDLSLKSDQDFYGVASDDLGDDIPEIIVDPNACKSYMSLVDASDEFFDDDI